MSGFFWVLLGSQDFTSVTTDKLALFKVGNLEDNDLIRIVKV